MLKRLLLSLLFLAISGTGLAQAPAASASDAAAAEAAVAAEKARAEALINSLKYQEGKIALPGGIATLSLPAQFRYLSPADTERVLTEGWGNPPGHKTLGMIVPRDAHVLSNEGWGVVVTYSEDGHVADDEADQIKYDELLVEMKKANQEENAARKEQGFAPMTLTGWAEAPSYDKVNHKLYWAQEFNTGSGTPNTLNYNIRVLGRKGVLVLNAVATMDQIATIRQEMKHVTAFSEFTPGNKYTDFNAATDKVAEYGIAALVAGGVASKLGLFGKLLALLLAFKKLIIIGVGAIGVAAFNFFRGRSAAKVNLEK
jgi:uncharacterized membrane-anchored protein